jgi:transposase-like protein
MANTRKRYSADFKAKVALEALKGDLTLAQLAALGGDTPNEAYARKGAQPDPGLTPDQAEPKLKLAA